MACFARVLAVDIPHHVTQRGNAQRFILDCDADRIVYLNLLRKHVELYDVSLIGYCLMSNHVHLVTTPRKAEELSSGHVWQGRYYSCPLDSLHLWQALRYTELNPVRAGLVRQATQWNWSSAAFHCGETVDRDCVAEEPWKSYWTVESRQHYLASAEKEEEIAAIRQSTHTGRPLGTEEFIHSVEQSTKRRLAPLKGGRPRKPAADSNQRTFDL